MKLKALATNTGSALPIRGALTTLHCKVWPGSAFLGFLLRVVEWGLRCIRITQTCQKLSQELQLDLDRATFSSRSNLSAN